MYKFIGGDAMSCVQPHPNQHYRLSVTTARRDYADGLITAAGLLYYCVGVLRKRGQRVAMSVKDWMNLTGLPERTFYKAKAKLVSTGRLDERITGSVELWMSSPIAGVIEPQSSPRLQDCPTLPERSTQTERPIVHALVCPTVQAPTQSTVQTERPTVPASTCPTVQPDCPIVQPNCPNGQVTGPIVQVDCPIVRNPPPKASTSKPFKDSPDNSNRTNKPTLKKVTDVKSVIRKPGKAPEIPRDLRRQLEELGILDGSARDAGVLRRIAAEDISKAYGAAAQVERSFESCYDPRGLFLSKLRNQPIEKIGLIQPLRTAAEFKLPIAALKQRYPPGIWQEAALAYGYSEEEIEDADET
jgi:hypothetical protein